MTTVCFRYFRLLAASTLVLCGAIEIATAQDTHYLAPAFNWSANGVGQRINKIERQSQEAVRFKSSASIDTYVKVARLIKAGRYYPAKTILEELSSDESGQNSSIKESWLAWIHYKQLSLHMLPDPVMQMTVLTEALKTHMIEGDEVNLLTPEMFLMASAEQYRLQVENNRLVEAAQTYETLKRLASSEIYSDVSAFFEPTLAALLPSYQAIELLNLPKSAINQ